MGIFDLDRWNEVWQTIQRNKKRSIMTAFGVFWGVFMLVVLLGFGMGLGRYFVSNLGEMSTNTAFFFTNSTSIPYKGMPTGRWWNMDIDDVARIQSMKEVKYASPIYWNQDVTVSRNGLKKSHYLGGKSPVLQKIDPQSIVKGRFLSDLDEENFRKVCVIGTQVERDMFPNGENPLGQTIQVNNAYYTVVGVVERKNNMVQFEDTERTISIPSGLYRQIYGLGKNVGAIAITGRDNVKITDLEIECKKVVAAAHLISPDDKKAIGGFNLGEMFDKMNGLFSGILLLTWVVGAGTLIAGIVGVSNIMLVVVKERTQEIGVRRALGAKPRVIISQILSESFVLTFVAGIFGLAAAVGVLTIADSTLAVGMAMNGNHAYTPSFQISFGMGMLCSFIIVAGSLLAGLIPANRAMTIKAVDALRDE